MTTLEMSDKRKVVITSIKSVPKDDIAKALARIFTAGDYDKYLEDCFINLKGKEA
jgi:hypothetical protein